MSEPARTRRGIGMDSVTPDIEAKMKSFHDIFHPRQFVCLLFLSPLYICGLLRSFFKRLVDRRLSLEKDSPEERYYYQKNNLY